MYVTRSRRKFLQVGALGTFSLSLPMLLQARAAHGSQGGLTTASFGRAKHCLVLFLTGGPSQLDTFDPKPGAPAEIRGEFKPIATAVPGMEVTELFPRLAGQADKLCIVRSVTHSDAVHPSAGYTMLTGHRHPRPGTGALLARPGRNDHPNLGSLLARFRSTASGMPPFVSLPEVIKDDAVNEYPGQGGGMLGKPCDPFRIEADAARLGFRRPEILLPVDVPTERMRERRALRALASNGLSEIDQRGPMRDLDGFYQQAFGILSSPAADQAFRIDEEPESLRSAYGPHLFGRGCLLARRLLEAGVLMATVYWHYEGPADSPVWDSHQNIFVHMRNRLAAPADQAIAALLADLSSRGMLDETLVICTGEFGRTPRIALAGRGHWPQAQSILLAGAGIPAGTVYGATDRIGGHPADRAMTPADLAATILHLLGVDPAVEIHDALGRPYQACTGRVVPALIGDA